MASSKSNAVNWFLHRITGTFLVFMLITHFWVQHYDHSVASVTTDVVAQEGELPTYSDEAAAGVKAKFGADAEVTPYNVVMQRLADPVYAVLWKGFNILFLIVALHHGFYGLNNVLTDYIRNPLGRVMARVLSWSVALVLLIIGLYSVITAGW
ncbi:succinate dehydrogenase hydrophobic membrane anchor subunit [Longibacter sp.]|jgi:succinate dehydrogenase / fumarate reductase membrane anchor subunit|uniref:succinate dehydrogenase hydrophobic membrane anchor subunit n=1 Tax=Longibacter sp. TaxID=2045415 RepID=UPI001E0D9B2D|nr:succinate dehydrogenase [Bacteroidota bacterium]